MTSVTKTSGITNPFPGLRSFTPDDSRFFFGRAGEVDEIVDKLLKNRFVAVIGSSASGKSSLINCGLHKHLTGLQSRSGEEWKLFTLKPGNDPFGNLADALSGVPIISRESKPDRKDLKSQLESSVGGFQEVITKLKGSRKENILVIIDQFEELFRYDSLTSATGLSSRVSGFVKAIYDTAESKAAGIYILIAIDSDHISDLFHFKDFTRLINTSNFLMPRMGTENFREMIEGPLAAAGASMEPELIEALLEEIGGHTDQLPVLQHTLSRIWVRWNELEEPGKAPGISDYYAVGTLKDAITDHADEVFESLGDEGKLICEKLFKYITRKSPDTKATRFPSTIALIRSSIRCTDDALKEVIGRYSGREISFLTSSSGENLNDQSVIDLSHECLVRQWERLACWISEEAEAVEVYNRLSEASALYQQGKAGLLKQPELQLVLRWRNVHKPSLAWAVKYNPAFERAIVYLRTSEKEFLESEERKARQHRWKLRRARIFTSVLGGVAIFAAILMAVSLIGKLSSDKLRKEAEKRNAELAEQRTAAEEYATLALKRSIEADSNAIVATCKEQQEKKLREMAEAFAIEARRGYDSVLEGRLQSDMDLSVALGQKAEIQRMRMISVAKSMSLRSFNEPAKSDIRNLLAYQAYLFNRRNNGHPNDADIYRGLYNVSKLNKSPVIRSFKGYEGQVRSMAFIPGRREFFTSGSDGKLLKWNLDNPDQKYQIVYSDTEVIDVMAVSPGADWLACGGNDPDIRMIPVRGGDQGYELKGHSARVRSLVFSSDGRYLYSAGLDGKVFRWDLTTRTASGLSTDMLRITSVDLSSDDRYLAGISTEGNALIWNPEKESDKFNIESAGKTISSIRFKPDAQKIGVGYDDGTVEIWDLASGKKENEVVAHDGEVSDIRFNPGMNQVATAGKDSMLKLWDLKDLTNPPVSFDDITGLVIAFDFSSDGDVIVSAGVDDKNVFLGRPTSADALAANACTYVTRNFTGPEWIAWVGKDIEYEKTCSDSDFKIRIRELNK